MLEKVLIANRGEIAIRICRAAGQLGIRTVAVYAEDDAASLHTRKADIAVELTGAGVGSAAYLNQEALLAAAAANGCRAIARPGRPAGGDRGEPSGHREPVPHGRGDWPGYHRPEGYAPAARRFVQKETLLHCRKIEILC